MDKHAKIQTKLEECKGHSVDALIDTLKGIFASLNTTFKVDQDDVDELRADFLPALEKALATEPNDHMIVVAHLTSDALIAAREVLSNREDIVRYIALSSRDYCDMRRLCRDYLDVECSAIMLKAGLMGLFLTARVMVDRSIPVGDVYLIGMEHVCRIQVVREAN